MPLYMLDTDICSYIMKRSSAAVLARLGRASGGEICMSSITHSELLFGVEVSPRQERDREALNGFCGSLRCLLVAKRLDALRGDTPGAQGDRNDDRGE